MRSLPDRPGIYAFDCRVSIFKFSIGVSVIAANADALIVMVTIYPNCWNITPIIPETMVIGNNTATMVSTNTITISHTSLVA